jgi:hypothetical protein
VHRAANVDRTTPTFYVVQDGLIGMSWQRRRARGRGAAAADRGRGTAATWIRAENRLFCQGRGPLAVSSFAHSLSRALRPQRAWQTLALQGCTKPFVTASCRTLDRLFTMDPLGADLAMVFIAVLGFYFGSATIRGVAGLFRKGRQ